MNLKASEIQKLRIKEIEDNANELLSNCNILFVTSIYENGYPRTCCVSKAKANDFHDIYYVTSKRSEYQGKAKHFESNTKSSICYQKDGNSVTLVGNVEFVEDKQIQQSIWNESDRMFFSKGINDPKFRLIKFHTIEATFWINGKFRTVKYK